MRHFSQKPNVSVEPAAFPGVSATDEITWSEQLYRIFEFDLGVPVTLELIGTRVHPEDIPLFDDMIDRVRARRSATLNTSTGC